MEIPAVREMLETRTWTGKCPHCGEDLVHLAEYIWMCPSKSCLKDRLYFKCVMDPSDWRGVEGSCE